MKNYYTQHRKVQVIYCAFQRGFSLVELMIASALSFLIMFGLIQLYSTNMAGSRLQGAIAYTQENALVGLNLIQQDIRKAGYLGLENATNEWLNYLDKEDRDSHLGLRAITYDSSSTVVPVAAAWASDLLKPSDVLSIAWVADELNSTENFKTIEVCPDSSEDSLTFVSVDFSTPTINCTDKDKHLESGSTFDKCSPYAVVEDANTYLIAQGDNTDNKELKFNQTCGSNVDQYDAQYSVCKSTSGSGCDHLTEDFMDDLVSQSKSNISLYDVNQAIYFVDSNNYLHRVVNGVDTKIIPDVESLSFKFGVDNNGDKSVDVYEGPAAVASGDSWHKVVSVEFTLKLKSPSNGMYGQSFSKEYKGVSTLRNRVKR